MPSLGSTAVRGEITPGRGSPPLILNSLSSKRQTYVKKKTLLYVIVKEWTIIGHFVF